MVGWAFHPTYNERNDIMYIEPNSTLYILKNVPLDTTYDHTLWFDTVAEQAQYFSSLAKYRLSYQNGTALTYVRVNRGTIKVPFKADALYDCNYIMFRNNGFGDKWFYAFIRSVEFVNNTTAEITFELDVMQTWHFDYTIDQCFVEREHSVDDALGENTIPENVDLGDYISEGMFGSRLFTAWRIVVITSCKVDLLTPFIDRPADGVFINGTYQQLEYNIFSPDAVGIAGINNLLTALALTNHDDILLGIYLFPIDLIPPTRDNWTESHDDGQITKRPATICQYPTTLAAGKYTPKNNKLLTYPYTYLSCTNFEGIEKVYKFELFRDSLGLNPPENMNIQFHLFVDMNVRPTAMIAPVNYMEYSLGYTDQPNINEGLCITNFPMCQYTMTDAGAKLVQAGIGMALTAASALSLSPALGSGGYEYFSGPRSLTTSSTSKTAAAIANNLYTGITSQGVKTGPASNNIMQSALSAYDRMAKGVDFGFRILSIRPEYARIIDDYFSCYGYATKRVKTPNRNSRPHWNYVKTIGCTIKGSIPCDDMARVCNIYNNGITFWKHGDEVGNYSLDNSPT